MPAGTTALGKPAVVGATKPQETGVGGIAKTDPIASQVNKDTASPFSESDFNQLVDQLVAESTAAKTVPAPAVPVAATTGQSVKLSSKPATVSTDQLPDLPAPVLAVPVRLADPPVLNAVPASGRRGDAHNSATPSTTGAAQPFAVVDVNILIPIAPKSPLPSNAGGGSVEQRSASVPTSSADEPAAIVLQASPLLEVKIRLHQPDTPAATFSVGMQIIPTSTVANATVGAATSARSPVSLPAVVMPVVVAPKVSQGVASLIVTAPVSTAAAPVESQALSRGAAQDTTGRPATSSSSTSSSGATTIQPAMGSRQEAEGAPTGQNSERGAPDPRDAEIPPATAVSGHTLSRTAIDQAPPVIVQPQTPDTGSTLPPVHNSVNAAAGAVPVPPTPAPAPMTVGEAKPETPPSSAPLREESPLDKTKTQQPIRSLALEFAPDGAGDIKVRLSERGGDVHISLHGTDPALAGRVREGVSDLVGSLSKAGYDAEAWTPDQGRQNQRQESEQRQTPRKTPGGTDAEAFSGILQQPIQEIS